MNARHLILLRKTSQITFFILFIAFTIFSRGKFYPHPFSNIFFQLDPLLVITATVAGRLLVPGIILTVSTLIVTILFGRVWCSWFCPLGTLFDWIKPKKKARAKLPEHLRKVKYILLISILLLSIFGAEFYTYLDPITILHRTLSISFVPALKVVTYEVESFFYRFEPLWGLMDWIHNQIIFPIFRDLNSFFQFSTLTILLCITLLSLNWIAERFWCRYLCPLGGLLGLLSKYSLLRRVVTSDCTSCKQCAHVCPTATIDEKHGFISNPAECTMCFICKDDCRFNANQFQWSIPTRTPNQSFQYDPNRRDLLTGISIAVGSFAFARLDPKSKEDIPTIIRPPGAIESGFESICVRCSQCMNSCPTQGLQPSGFENGWANLFTPQLIPRRGYCDYNCTACIDICPTDALGSLNLEEKQITPIGLARIDQNRCLPWAYLTSCIICEEACPLPEKAVKFQEQHVQTHKDEEIIIKRPYVVRELCIGCGICEHKCPLTGEAAIRVFTPPKDINSQYLSG